MSEPAKLACDDWRCGWREDAYLAFADNLKRQMTLAGLTSRELAAKLGVSTVTVQHWRNGRWLPKLPQALALRRLFGCSVEELFADL